MVKEKKLRVIDIVMSVICTVFTAEAIAPAAAIGNSSFFWWGLLIITFLMPYGLVVAEMGTAYPEDGGIYAWTRDALGPRFAARESWYYWVNYTTWLASLSLLYPTTINGLLGFEMGPIPELLIELAFIWIITFLSTKSVGESTWLLNSGAVLQVSLTLVVGCLGLYHGITNGWANPFTAESMMPDLTNFRSVTYLSMILFNFMGFEVIATFYDSMDKPKRDMPRALIIGGATIAFVYLFSSLGITAAIPHSEINMDSGIADAVAIIAGNGSFWFYAVSMMFMCSLFADLVSWSFGVADVTNQAAKEGNLPAVFAIEDKRGLPIGSTLMNGCTASFYVVLKVLLGPAVDGFYWVIFSLNVVFTLAAYLFLFPDFYIMRKKDPDHPRPFRVPGGKAVTLLFAVVPVVELVLSVVVSAVPLNGSPAEMEKLPLLIGAAIVIVLGEFVPALSKLGRRKAKN